MGPGLQKGRLHLMPAIQKGRAMDSELTGQMQRRGSLSEAPEDLDDLGTGVAGLLPVGAREHVEDVSAGFASVVQDGCPMAIMGKGPGGQGMALTAAQTLGMQVLHQEVVAGLLVQKVVNGQSDHRGTLSIQRADIPPLKSYRQESPVTFTRT